MFTVILCLAVVCQWLAFELYWQAQRAELELLAVREQVRRSHEYLKAQLPRGCTNVRKTVPVNYADGIPDNYDWNDDLEKTQALPESAPGHSGMRSRIR